MPEPFKNLFSHALIKSLGQHLRRGSAHFDAAGFIKVASAGLDDLELKARSRQITSALNQYLPKKFPQACDLLLAVLHPDDNTSLSEMAMDDRGVRGWAIMPMGDFIAQNGMQHFDLSMSVLAEMTKRFSSEFAVRPFLIADLARAETFLHRWAQDSNEHVRRFASEGSRPRLPWGMQIPELIKNPRPTLPVLEQLRDDPSEYVRKSVANHLNDIAKDHPKVVVDIAKKWLKKAPQPRQRLVRHACRTLIKQGNADILQVFGYALPELKKIQFSLSARKIEVGEALTLNLTVTSSVSEKQSLMVDYIVHFVLANGKHGKKVFKWKSFVLPGNESLTLSKQHVFRPITIRTFYPGLHKVELQLNGQIIAEQKFELCLPSNR